MKSVIFTIFVVVVTSCGTDPKSTTPKATDPQSAAPKANDPKSVTPKATDPQSATPKATDPQSATPKANETICKMINEISVCSDKLSDETMRECFTKVENLSDVGKPGSIQEADSEKKQKWFSVVKSYTLCMKSIHYTTPSSDLNSIKQCLKTYHSDLSKIFHCE